MGEMRNAQMLCSENAKGRHHSEVGVDRRIILELMLEVGWEGVDWDASGSG
jgi:hypothetical protein